MIKDKQKTQKKIISILFIASYLTIRFPLLSWLDQFGQYGSYYFEVIFVLAVAGYFRVDLKLSLRNSFRVLEAILVLLSGFLIFKGAGALKVGIPFNLNSLETIMFLLIVGPVLEELIFRLALWACLLELVGYELVVIIGTSVMFSFAHFFAWWSVPADLRKFIIYQTSYTLFLALYCAKKRVATGGVAAPVIAHFLFNLGFYIGSWL